MSKHSSQTFSYISSLRVREALKFHSRIKQQTSFHTYIQPHTHTFRFVERDGNTYYSEMNGDKLSLSSVSGLKYLYPKQLKTPASRVNRILELASALVGNLFGILETRYALS
jgi:hypothetical protein